MIQILKIEKNGNIIIDFISNDIPTNIESTLYKKCGYRKNDDFYNIKTWTFNKIIFELWGKTKGKENNKNLYNFTSFCKDTIYNNCLVIFKKNNKYIDFDINIWNKFIDNIVKNTENEEKNLDGDPNNKQKKDQYISHNDDNSDNSDNSDDSDSNSDDDDENSELKEESYLYSSENEL